MVVNLPKVILISDYHEVISIQNTLREILGNEVKAKEIVGEDYQEVRDTYGSYAALVYVGKKPSKKEIVELFLTALKEDGWQILKPLKS
jgi:hypothetical protein